MIINIKKPKIAQYINKTACGTHFSLRHVAPKAELTG